MRTADFNLALTRTLKYEGGYANDPDDTGGETYKGISRKNWPKWEGWKIIDKSKTLPNFPKNLNSNVLIQTLIADFYIENFWKKIQAHKMLNQQIAQSIFDTAVNMGTTVAIKLVQEALDVPQTGILDEKTIQILNNII